MYVLNLKAKYAKYIVRPIFDNLQNLAQAIYHHHYYYASCILKILVCLDIGNECVKEKNTHIISQYPSYFTLFYSNPSYILYPSYYVPNPVS